MSTISTNKALATYIARIRNADKKAYAQAVAAYGPESKQAEAESPNLSCMARQAVRMNIADIEAAK